MGVHAKSVKESCDFASMTKVASSWCRAPSSELQEEENAARKPPRPARQALKLSKKRRPAKLDVTASMFCHTISCRYALLSPLQITMSTNHSNNDSL